MAQKDAMLSANQAFAKDFDKGDLSMPPARKVPVLACMDARLHPETFLGLDIGDAHMIRNAGGRASDDALRSLIISNRLLGPREYLVRPRGGASEGGSVADMPAADSPSPA